MTIRGILFDKDGTLVDYGLTWIPINREAALFAARGDRALADELLALGGHDPATDVVAPDTPLAVGSHVEIADLFATRLGPRTPPRLADDIEHIFREGAAKHAALYAGVPETIAALVDDDYVLGVATNDSIGGLLASLGRHEDLLPQFRFLAGCDSGFGVKPGPGMALAFCEACDLDPAEIAVVGDARHDLVMGRGAGAGLVVGVLGGTSGAEDLGEADLILPGVTALPAALRLRYGG